MAVEEYRQLTSDELHKRLDESAQELFSLRLKVGQGRNTGRIRELRRQVARMKMVLAEKGLRV